MERKRYLELCQINSVYKETAIVLYKGIQYYPIELIIWFQDAKTKNSAYMMSVVGNSYLRSNIEDLEEYENVSKNK